MNRAAYSQQLGIWESRCSWKEGLQTRQMSDVYSLEKVEEERDLRV